MSKIWYDICNDYSLDPCDDPNLSVVTHAIECSEGIVYFNEHNEAIYLFAEPGLTEIEDFDDFDYFFS